MTDSAGSVRPGSVQPGIVVGVDGSPGSAEALRWARQTAALYGLPVTAVLAWTADGQPRAVHHRARTKDREGLTAAALDVLEAVVDRPSASVPQVEVARRVVHEPAVLALLAQSRNALMAVVGARDHGLFHRVLGGAVGRAVVHLSR